MRRTILISTVAAAVLLLLPTSGQAQFPEDALRLSSIGLGVGARSLGLGMAYTGVANDFSATYWNPAGLGQIKMSEFSAGLSHLSYGNDATFFDSKKSFNNSSTSLNNFGLIYPFPTQRGSLVFAVGYNRVNDFTTALSFDAFNRTGSIIPRLGYGLAYDLYLVDTLGNTPLVDSLQQRGKIIEGGGMNNWTFAVAVEAAKQLYLGIALTVATGSYSYNRDYAESDVLNKYTQARFGTDYAFSRLNLINTISSDISGFTAKFGLLYKLRSGARVGFNIKIPTFLTVREDFSTDGTSVFDVPDRQGRDSYNYRQDGKTEYDVTTPFIFSGGISAPLGELLLAGDLEYTDWTQMKFSEADPLVERYNTDIKELFRPTANVRVGAEYEFSDIGFRLRGGFAFMPSPYRGDPSSFAQKYVTGGFGFIIQESTAADFGYAYGFWDTYHVNYQGGPRTLESIRTHNLMFTLSYRF